MKFTKQFIIMISYFFASNVTLLAPPKPSPERMQEYKKALSAITAKFTASDQKYLRLTAEQDAIAKKMTTSDQEWLKLTYENQRIAREFSDVVKYQEEEAQNLERLFTRTADRPDPVLVNTTDIVTFDPKPNPARTVDMPLLAPHEVMRILAGQAARPAMPATDDEFQGAAPGYPSARAIEDQGN